MEAHPDDLDVDLWLFRDGPVPQSGRPQLTFDVRGVTGMDVTVYGPVRPLHRGHYGSWPPVPGQMLVELLATLKDERGNVVVDGFYEMVELIGEAGRRELRELRSGNVGGKARNVIPATANATLGIWLVKGNALEHMQELVEARIQAQGFQIVREEPDRETRLRHRKIVKARRGGGYAASRTEMDHSVARQVVEATRWAAGERDVVSCRP